MEIPKAYNPKDFEDKIYKNWEEKGYFNPDNLENKGNEQFSIVLPPPNVTGTLHLGHASMLAIEDLFVRYKRMKGFDTVWVPGTDHAAIATQNVVEKKLHKETGKTRHDLGREKFLEKVQEHVVASQDTIKNQVRKMGSSLDWSREAYTLDEVRSKAVRKVFNMMYDDGLIYRGNRIVNWCPRCHSTLADDEINYKEAGTKFYTFKYSKDFPFTIATTRPETKVGDTAVAVNPDDKRYKKYIGKEFEIDFVGVPLKIKIIADTEVDPEFGTGALGVTPAHSMIDYEMAQKNDLRISKVIDEDGKMTESAGPYAGMSVEEARAAIVKKLEDQGLLEKEEDMQHNLSLCYRCGTAIEPLSSDQWFIDVNKKITKKGNKYFEKGASLKDVALKVVRDKEINIIPERFEKTYFHWMGNLRDWCISRQIWFGHQIPVWYRKTKELKNERTKEHKGEEIYVGEKAPEGEGWVQDEDTLDTWFSSGLWTFTTLLPKDWDGKEFVGSDLKRFHPSVLMETGYDILFFWVARMILMTTYVMGEIPFENVFLHGLIRDKDGDKMSKSKPETAIDPLEAGQKYGFDAVRLSLLIGNTAGNDIRLYDEKIEGFRNFVNKLWNVSRFILTTVEDVEVDTKNIKPITVADKWILSRFNQVKKDVTKLIDEYNFSSAGEILRDFTWSEFADWYLEIAKVEKDKDAILMHILKNLLRMWHPYTPFVTEVIWENLKPKHELIISHWPEVEEKLIDQKVEAEFEKIKEIIIKIRNLRAEKKVEPVKKVKIIFKGEEKLIKDQAEVIKTLARVESIEFATEKPEQAASDVAHGIEIYLPLAGLIDTDKEKARLESEIDNVKAYLNGLMRKLDNNEFVNNAPKQVVDAEKKKMAEAEDKLTKLNEQLENFK